MESELLGNFRVKVAQNILLWSLETPCQAAFALRIFCEEANKFLNQTVIQTTSLIYAKEN